MLDSSRGEIVARLPDADLVLDVGGWAEPFARADWVLDLQPYDTRGLYGHEPDPATERFTATTWVQRDICDREPWPFADDFFDFAICSHTLEDVRDPIWVCGELCRVAKGGYVEVPSRLVEQSYGIQGPWVGWGHHHWLVDVEPGRIDFVFKHHVMHGRPEDHLPPGFAATLTAEQKVQRLWWTGRFDFAERVFTTAEGLDPYLRDLVAAHARPVARQPLRSRALIRARRAVHRHRRPRGS